MKWEELMPDAFVCEHGEAAKRWHTLHEEIDAEILTDHDWQDLILNEGYTLDDQDRERPKTVFDLPLLPGASRVPEVQHYLMERMLQVHVEPKLVMIKHDPRSPRVITDYSELNIPRYTISTAEGISLQQLSAMQREFLEYEHAGAILSANSLLGSAMEAFRFQAYLIQTAHTREVSHTHPEWGRVHKLYEKVIATMPQSEGYDTRNFGNTYNALDSMYYARAKSMLMKTAKAIEPACHDDFGRNFLITPEQINDEYASLRR
ncbi:MAG: hypothetical protein ACI8Y7_000498 [Candidatus Woesearchaeota archaeon]|jgi:hypothetical protein